MDAITLSLLTGAIVAGVVVVIALIGLATGNLTFRSIEYFESDDGRIHWRESGKHYSAQLDGGDKIEEH